MNINILFDVTTKDLGIFEHKNINQKTNAYYTKYYLAIHQKPLIKIRMSPFQYTRNLFKNK
ncbi:hypothetical protein phytr_10930 [Candidatus Phycorickettsia trachydisci]|uniref:Uncharacterized protein n=1 Tax=Candidatus Phycorickettsia trachydisci TaxID=2115978 RepID=A0A2P1P9T1_9RICK|nr:hypothetical protein phytr_10930 [Candidatus Phycorickettsia trachydisci]